MEQLPITRRGMLAAIAVTASGAMLPRAAYANTGKFLCGPEVCVLTPEVTEGPYYIDPGLVRRDIREDRRGVPMLARIQVVDAACAPLPGARVWKWEVRPVYPNTETRAGLLFRRFRIPSDTAGLKSPTILLSFKLFPRITGQSIVR